MLMVYHARIYHWGYTSENKTTLFKRWFSLYPISQMKLKIILEDDRTSNLSY